MKKMSLRAAVALGILMSNGMALANGNALVNGASAVPPAVMPEPSVEERMGIDQYRTGDPLLDKLIQGNYPLTTDQQLQVREYMEEDSKGLQRPMPKENLYGDPVYVIDVTQGGPTQEVPLQLGYVTNLMVVGENGASWPIRRVTTGDVAVVQPVIVEGDATSVELSPQTPWVTTNMHIYMAGRSEPIKLYTRVSADPADGLRDSIKIVIDGVPPGSTPLLQPNRVAVDTQLMNALGQSPGRNWQELRVANADQMPFRLSYFMAPNGKEAIVRIRNAQMVGPDWAAETRDPDGDVRVYRYQMPVPLMLRVRDSSGLEHQVRLDNPADLLAGRNTSRTMSVKQVSPARPPIDTALDFEPPAGLVRSDRTQTIHRASRPSDDTRPQYVSFAGKGQREQRVEIVDDLGLGRDTAKRMIEEAYRNRPAPLDSQLSIPGGGATPVAAPVDAPVQTSPAQGVSVNVADASASPISVGAQPSAEAKVMAATEPKVALAAGPDYTLVVRQGGLYENLYAYTEKHKWKAPIWDLGNEDIVIENSYTVTGSSPEDVLAKFLGPYSEAYKFNAKVSRTERAVWIK